MGSGLRGQRSPSVAAPITAAANFPKLLKKIFFGKENIFLKENHSKKWNTTMNKRSISVRSNPKPK